MSTRGLVHNDSLIFDGTNYDVWKIHMLNHFRAMDPNLERIVDMGFSPPKDSQNLSLEDEKNSYLDAQASNVLFNVVSIVVFDSIMPYRNAHEMWTKLHAMAHGGRTIGSYGRTCFFCLKMFRIL